MLSVDQLRNEVQAGRVDTVILALTDMQGRRQGKRLTARHFFENVLEHEAEACNHLLAADVEMNTVDGYAMSSWERGYGPALRIADEHSIYETGVKEIAAQDAMAITSMAEYDAREGSSCRIHMSVRRLDDAGFERFTAGQLACLRELTLLYAPNSNSYKRFAKGSFAPTAVAWGHDNRTCSVRVVGQASRAGSSCGYRARTSTP